MWRVGGGRSCSSVSLFVCWARETGQTKLLFKAIHVYLGCLLGFKLCLFRFKLSTMSHCLALIWPEEKITFRRRRPFAFANLITAACPFASHCSHLKVL